MNDPRQDSKLLLVELPAFDLLREIFNEVRESDLTGVKPSPEETP